VGINHYYTPERHPGGYSSPIIHPRGTLVGIVLPFTHPEAPWWVYHSNTPERHPGGYTTVTYLRGTLVGIYHSNIPKRHPGGYIPH